MSVFDEMAARFEAYKTGAADPDFDILSFGFTPQELSQLTMESRSIAASPDKQGVKQVLARSSRAKAVSIILGRKHKFSDDLRDLICNEMEFCKKAEKLRGIQLIDMILDEIKAMGIIARIACLATFFPAQVLFWPAATIFFLATSEEMLRKYCGCPK